MRTGRRTAAVRLLVLLAVSVWIAKRCPVSSAPKFSFVGGGALKAVHSANLRSRRLQMKAVPAETATDEDVGYNLLFENAADEFANRSLTTSGAFPAYVKGDFVIPSIGKFDMGDRKFIGFLDCFGKLQRFRIDGNRVDATYHMMETKFYNSSKQAATVSNGLLFFETEPPRENPWYLGPINNMPPFAPNDNTYVNTIRVGDELLSLTDSYTMTVLDPESMRVVGIKSFEDDLEGLVCYTGSAHPVRDPNTGDWLDFVGNANLFSEETILSCFSLSEKSTAARRKISDVVMETAPYMHSFGVTENYMVLPRMPVKFSAQEVAMKPMAAAFQQVDLMEEGPGNAFHIVPLDGSPGFVRTLPLGDPLWYVHTANAYENATGIVIDLSTTAQNPFASDLTIAASRSKEIRDQGATGSKNVMKRYLLPWDSGVPVTTEVLSDAKAATDFPTINPKFQSRKHCFYWAVEWFAHSDSYASMAIVKHDVCNGDVKRVWSRDGWYPSEATMVPSDQENAAEDDGVLLLTALDGAKDQTFLIGLDAKTMEVVAEAGPFPRIAFTTHGSFYPAAA
eukprot:TRINITY_DN113910_c0_g1_i1.p1 TRINITY_DN113910_c0_g1~~TRINITY_DN113910_c0_g1_i1.p1  ORF type:complete len:589 (+),score=76.62 TRINITY_DN113910_c0_g1_i1:73-1767(+)